MGLSFTHHADGTHTLDNVAWEPSTTFGKRVIETAPYNSFCRWDRPNWLVRIVVANGSALYRVTGEETWRFDDGVGGDCVSRVYRARLLEGEMTPLRLAD